MFTNNGSNKNTSNTTCSKLGLTAKINDLSKKNNNKIRQKNTANNFKNNKFPKKSYNNEIENQYSSSSYNYSSAGSRKKSGLYNSVNVDYYQYDDPYLRENMREKKKKNDSKKSGFYYNNKINTDRNKKLKDKEKSEKERKEKERLLKEKEIERLLREKEEKEKLLREKEEKEKLLREKEAKERIEKERKEELRKKVLLEVERKKLQIIEEEKEKLEREKLEKEKKEKKEKLEREKLEKEKKEKEKLERDKLYERKDKLSNTERNIYSQEEESTSCSDNSSISSITKSKVGLRNLGNTCFMNTCLQNLIHSELFIQKLFSKSFLLSSKTRISKQFYSLCKEVSSCSSSACAPYDFKSAFGSKHSMFSGYGQHDTQEFCRILLEDMNSELNEVLHPSPYKELSTLNKSKKECDKEFDEVFRKRENSLVMDVFYGQLINIFKCECDFETYSFEKILDLPLLLQKHRSSISIDIKDLLKDYFECERIKFETKCEKCKKKEWHTKEIKISQPPNILILSLQRQNPRTGSKNNCYVDFSDELDMSIYLDHECWNKNDAKYTLYGIGNHSGSIDFGHYYAYIKINNSWYEFNDSHVSPYSKRENNSSSQAYILFYKKNSI
jgi:ubiquitin C-terminal hydrolase